MIGTLASTCGDRVSRKSDQKKAGVKPALLLASDSVYSIIADQSSSSRFASPNTATQPVRQFGKALPPGKGTNTWLL
jgi:hypothetical protein